MNNRGQGGTVGCGGLGFVVSGLAAGVGLASESIHHHKENKAAKKAATTAQRQLSGPKPLPVYDEHENKGAEYAGDETKGAEQPGQRSLEEGDEE